MRNSKSLSHFSVMSSIQSWTKRECAVLKSAPMIATYAFINVGIFENLHFSSVAVVDVTGERPNCFIELGYALRWQPRSRDGGRGDEASV